jgi:uncharacterized glyoxalase superfamily protein PhnB
MTQPRFGSVNLVVADVEAAASFLTELGVPLDDPAPEWAEWAVHHRNASAGDARFDVDLDSPAFASWWGGVPRERAPGAVVNLHVGARDEVDRLHRLALASGAEELRAPYDAFWGARFSVVLAPGPLCVGLMSAPDPGRRTAPPAISDFA